MVLTSPPYFRLRDYVSGQLGLEQHVDQWVDDLRSVMRELHRVLLPSGSLWLNLGDSYATHQREGAPRKSLLLAPERLALRLVADGWILRNKIVWQKANPMPTSVGDRLACTWEVIYVFAQQPGYYWAEQLGALVVEEFIDAGESARSADRPELQKMLIYLLEHPGIRYVIVHKVDRLARNRVDDVEINLAIRKAGATLVSCTENIDETPSGMLLHGIMSSIAEFYSRNLANEVIKGTEQKVKSGGTPTLAPLGYLNTREIVNGRETRTVILDPERAELVRFAFETYATGDWSLNRLAHELGRVLRID